jgi:hypothetical protein
MLGTKNAPIITDRTFTLIIVKGGGQEMKSSNRLLFSFILILLSISVASPASADTAWTDWTSATIGGPGSAVGTLNGVAVTYTGEILTYATGGTAAWYWAPDSSFIGGTVTTSPSIVGDLIGLQGSYTGINTITFGSQIVNPVFAIWSLGSPSIHASFVNFSQTPTFEAGGPNSQYGGGPITVLGNTVSGLEGNGVVQFTGTFTTLTWTNTSEYWYAFTVGTAEGSSSLPEPATLLLLGFGLLGLAGVRRVRK